MRNSRPLDWLLVALALVAAGVTAWIDFHATEPQPAASLILISSGLLGLTRPVKAWRWGLILGASLFVGNIVFQAMGLQPRSAAEPGAYAALLALIPAFIGAYAGVLFNRLITGGKSGAS